MSFIAVDLLSEYPETEKGNCYALFIICMLMSFVSIVSIKNRKAETVINAYIKYIYIDKGRLQFILSYNGKEFSSASMAYMADQLEFIKVYTSPLFTMF